MATIPRRNLGPESEPWGRSVDQRLAALERNYKGLEQDNRNAFKGINASISGISKALKAVQENQAQLAAQQTALENVVDDVAAQQDELAQTVEGLPNHQIRGNSLEISSIGTSFSSLFTFNITIPSAHNYVWMVITNNGLFQADQYNGGVLNIRTSLSTNGGLDGYWDANYSMADNPYFNVSNTYQNGYSVPNGATVTTEIEIRKTVGSTSFSNKNLLSIFSVVSYTR